MIVRPNSTDSDRSWMGGWVLRRASITTLSALCGIGLATVLWHGVPAAWALVKAHPYFAVKEIDVDGNLRLSREDVLEWTSLRLGSSIWDAEPSTLRMRLQKNPWVEHARAWREFPSRVGIRVQERRPVALAQLAQLTYIDRHARMLGPLGDEDSRDFVVISGLEDAGEEFVNVGLHRAVKLLRLCERMNCFEALSEVHVDRKRGITLFPMHTPVAVVLGWGGWREKLTRSARVLAAWQGQVDRLGTIDVSFRGIAVVRLRDEAAPGVEVKPKHGMRV
jgi:cell division protein FtsQ